MPEADFFLGPQQDARAQTIRLNQTFHEVHLVDTNGEKEPRELHESLFAESAAAIEIAAARLIAVGQERFVFSGVACQAAGNR